MKAYVSGFGSPGINGIYDYNVDIDGYPSYKKDDHNYLIYYKEYMPYSMSPQYYLIKVFYLDDECQKIKVPKFHVLKTDPTENQWKTDSNSVSGETEIGTVEIIESSSSSSSSYDPQPILFTGTIHCVAKYMQYQSSEPSPAA